MVSLGIGSDNTAAEAASATALARFQGNFKEGRYEEARADALRALVVAPGNPAAAAALQQACEALARQPQPVPASQCTYVGTNMHPVLPPVDPAVVGALQRILIDGEKTGPFGGSEEAEPKDDGSKPAHGAEKRFPSQPAAPARDWCAGQVRGRGTGSAARRRRRP